MRFGIIGTNQISSRFVRAVEQCAGAELGAVYSRSLERAGEFAKKCGAEHIYDNLEAFASSPQVEAVYIASPNSLHCAQALAMLQAGKHVLCEKPIASNSRELHSMLDEAKRRRLVLLEAARPVLSPVFDQVRKLLPRLGTIRRVSLVFHQYSSRYDNFKHGIIENAFNPELSNSALMDIGTYCVQWLVGLFGLPKRICSSSIILRNGFEGQGAFLGAYEGMMAEVTYSKISQSYGPSSIQGEDACLTIDHLTNPATLTLYTHGGTVTAFPANIRENNSIHVIDEFIRCVRSGGRLEEYQQCSVQAMAVMDELRAQQGIVFPADRL